MYVHGNNGKRHPVPHHRRDFIYLIFGNLYHIYMSSLLTLVFFLGFADNKKN